MKLKFREQATCTLLGLAGVGAPALVINHATYGLAPGPVLGGLLVASIVGFGFGAWTMSRAYNDANEQTDTEVCESCCSAPEVTEVQA
jgi:hypothetical protein